MAQISTAKAKSRGRIAGLSRSIRNGERPADCPELRAAYRELAVITVEEDATTLADKAAKLVADWPDLTPEQLDRVAGIIRGGSTAQNYAPGGGAA